MYANSDMGRESSKNTTKTGVNVICDTATAVKHMITIVTITSVIFRNILKLIYKLHVYLVTIFITYQVI